MHMKDYDKLKDALCEELEKIAKEGRITASNLEAVHKLTDTIKNIAKIEMLEGEDDGYSEARYGGLRGNSSYADGRRRMIDDDGMSYANRRGSHYVRGHYSMDDGRDYMLERVEELMEDADPKSKEILKRAVKQLENA